jgi:hypothetical protein
MSSLKSEKENSTMTKKKRNFVATMPHDTSSGVIYKA